MSKDNSLRLEYRKSLEAYRVESKRVTGVDGTHEQQPRAGALGLATGSAFYAPRPTEDLGGYYTRHVEAMTAAGLHSKSAIAAELAWRDMEIDGLLRLLHDIRHEATLHGEHNPISGITRLPRGYQEIINLADRAISLPNK